MGLKGKVTELHPLPPPKKSRKLFSTEKIKDAEAKDEKNENLCVGKDVEDKKSNVKM